MLRDHDRLVIDLDLAVLDGGGDELDDLDLLDRLFADRLLLLVV